MTCTRRVHRRAKITGLSIPLVTSVILILSSMMTLAAQPVITGVSIPAVSMKINDIVTVTISVQSDSATLYTLREGTIGGYTIDSLRKEDNTTYTATFVVTEGGMDCAAADAIPTSLTLADGEDTGTWSTAISQANDPLDANRPNDPTPESSGHTINVWDNDDTVEISFSAEAFDGSGSGVDGFEIEWDQIPTWTPMQSKEHEETWPGATFAASANGEWYLHIATVDNVGNWSRGVTLGPFWIDVTPPSVPASLTPANGTHTNDMSPTLTWNASTDTGGSGLRDNSTYRVVVIGIPSKSYYTASLSYTPTLADGIFAWKAYARDNAGNSSGYSMEHILSIDRTQPDVILNQASGQADPTTTSPVVFTAVFDESINAATFTSADIALSGAATASVVTVTEIEPNDGTTFSVIVSLSSGSTTATIPAGSIEDLAGNTNNESTSTDNTITVDSVAPNLTSFERQNPAMSSSNADSLIFRATFDKIVVNVGASDFTVNGTTTAAVTNVSPISGSVYDATISGGDLAEFNGDVGLDLSDDQDIADVLGNALPPGEPGIDETYLVDNSNPTEPTPTSSSHTVGIWDSDVTVDIAIAGADDPGGSGVDGFGMRWDQSATWEQTETKEEEETWSGATFIATSDGDWYFHIAAVDNVGNWTSSEHLGPFQVDSSAPSVPTGLGPGDSTYTNDLSPTLSWEACTDTGGSGLRDTSAYRVVVSGAPSKSYYTANLTYTPTLAEGIFTWMVYSRDNADNVSSSSAEYTLTIDITAPTMDSLSADHSDLIVRDADSVTVCATFDEDMTSSPTISIDVSGAGPDISEAAMIGSEATWTYSWDVPAGNTGETATVAIAGKDIAGNAYPGSDTIEYSIDNTNPRVTGVEGVDFLFEDRGTAATVTVTFHEAMGAAIPSVFETGASAPGWTIDNIRWDTATQLTFDYNVLDEDQDHLADVSFQISGAQDAAGNAMEQHEESIIVDTVKPTVAGVDDSTFLFDERGSTVTVTVTFHEAMGAAIPSVFETGASAPGWTIDNIRWDTATQLTFDYNVLDEDQDHLAGVSLQISRAQDAAGNAMEQHRESIIVDTVTPSVVSIVRASASPTNASSIDFTLTFSESVTGVDASDFTLDVSGIMEASIGPVSGRDTTWTVLVNTGTGDAVLSIDLSDDDSIEDVAGNKLGGIGAHNGNYTVGGAYTIDKTAPTTSICAPSASDANTGPVTYTVTYSDADAVTLALGDVTLNKSGTADGTVSVGGSGTASRTVAISDIIGNGTLGISISVGTASDNAGNSAAAAGPSTVFNVDNAAPTAPTTVESTSHTTSSWSNDTSVDVWWWGASDTASGVACYSYEWSTQSDTVPDTTQDQVHTSDPHTATSSSLGDGNSHWFHIRTRDGAGNWTSTEHVGPFQIDTTPPTVPTGLSPSSGAHTNDTSPTLSWDASTDTGGSGLRDIQTYRVVVTGTPSKDYYTANLTYTPTLAEGVFAVKVYARDKAGNSSAYSTECTLTIDATQPNVTMDQENGQADPATASPVIFTAAFDESIDDATFTNGDVTIGGTAATGAVTVSEIAPNDGTTFSVTVIVIGDGTVIAAIPAGGVEDLASNTNTASLSNDNSVTYDGSRPTVTIDQAVGQADATNGSPILFTAVFDEAIRTDTFASADVTVGGTATTGEITVSEIAPNDGTTFSVSVVVTAKGTVTVAIPAGGVEDWVGNTNDASTSNDSVVTYDSARPDVTIDQAGEQADPTNASLILFTAVFDKPINAGTFASADVTIGGTATTGAVTVDEITPNDGMAFSVSAVVIADGTVSAAIPAGGVEDLIGNTNNASTSNDCVVTYDATRPDVTIDQAGEQADPTNSSLVVFTAVFDEPINIGTFINTDVAVGGTATTGEVTVREIAPNDGMTFSVSAVVTADGTVTASVPAGCVEDPAGNVSAASTSTDNLVTVDTDQPSVISILRETPTSEYANDGTVAFRITFDEDVQHADESDFVLSGTARGTIDEVMPMTGQLLPDSEYRVWITGVSGRGELNLDIAHGNDVQDIPGNELGDSPTIGSEQTYIIDTIDPAAPTLSSSSDSVNVWDNDATVDIQIVGASDDSSGVDGFEIAWDQSAAWTPTQTKEHEETWVGATYTATAEGEWYFHIAAADNAGNWTRSEHLGPFLVDTSPPSVPVRRAPANGVYTSDKSPTLAWDASTDAGGSGMRTTGAYRVIVAGTPSRDYYANGTSYAPTLAEGVFTWKLYARDNAGNNSAYSTVFTLTIDATVPNVTVEQADGQADSTTSSPIVFTAVFDEPINMATLSSADVTIEGTATTGTVSLAEVSPNDGTTFSVAVVLTGDGTVAAGIAAGSVEDHAGNSNTASTSTDNEVTYDVSKPSVTIDQAAGQADPTKASSVLFMVVFDEAINDATFTDADVSVGGSATTGSFTVAEIVPNDGTTFEVSVSVLDSGTVIPTIPAGGVEDLAGNFNNASASSDNTVTVDVNLPTVTRVTPIVVSGSDVGIVLVSITFDDAMDTGTNPSPTITGLTTGPYTITGSTWSNGDQTWTGSFTFIDDNEKVNGIYTILDFKDAAGNAMPANMAWTLEVDTANPTADVTVSDLLITDADAGGEFTITVAFSEGMNTDGSADPTLVFSPDVEGGGLPTLISGSGNWGGADDIYAVTFDLQDCNVDVDSITIDILGAEDSSGNSQQDYEAVHEFEIDTLNATVSSVELSDPFIESADVGNLFGITVTFSEIMMTDGSANPVLTFSPAVGTTLSPHGQLWTSTTYEFVYDTLDDNVVEDNVGVSIQGAKDVNGNTLVAYDSPDLFDVDTLTPVPAAVPSFMVVPMGAAGPVVLLDRCLDLPEGEEPPMVGLCPLTAIYDVGELVTGACGIFDPSGSIMRGSYIHVFIYAVSIDARPETLALLDHWVVRYDQDRSSYSYSWDTTDHAPGYYDVYLSFGDGTSLSCRIQLVEPVE